MKKLFIISNESIFKNRGKFFCDNLDLKSTPESLNQKFEVNIIARSSKKKRSHEIKLKNIKIFTSIFYFIIEIIKTIKKKNSKYLIISITPFTFLACVFLKLLKKNPVVYLRSDGYDEYKLILGFIGPIIYHIMFLIASNISTLISCRKYILRGKKGNLIHPSQIDSNWRANPKFLNFNKTKLLYVGRIRKEKGIFSLLSLIKNLSNVSLTIVGLERNSKNSINEKNIEVKEIENTKKNLIKYYDDHNIFVLPSFTEGYPMVILESLARLRPVIVFEEIKHVAGKRKGIFISKRNTAALLKVINYIKKNSKKIQNDIKKNKLPDKKDFINRLSNIILNN
jgi:glycosyltransferase involved in cell wall biosynthesis